MLKSRQLKIFRLVVGYLLILGILIGNGFFLHRSFIKMSEQESWVLHTQSVIAAVDSTISAVKDAETGTRGYLLTNRLEYLGPFITGSMEARSFASKVISMTADNPDQQRNAIELRKLVDERMGVLQAMIDKRKSSRLGDVDVGDYIAQGKVVMDILRSHVDTMKASETELYAKRKVEAEDSRHFFFYALVGSTLLSVFILSAAFLQFRRSDIRNEQEIEQNLRLSKLRENVAEVAKLTSGEVSLEYIANNLLHFLVAHLDVLAGKLFIMEKGKLKVIGRVGVTEDTRKADRTIDRNLLNEALRKKGVWEIKDIPPDFWRVQSGLGEAQPKNIIFVPIKFQDRPVALLELGAFQDLGDQEKELLEKITEILAINLNSAQSREHLHALLEETQTQAEELQSQQEELRTTNEELEQQARALESQQEAMNLKNEELEIIRKDLEFKARELELASQYKSEFLAKMSHELRTPLNGLLILSSLLFENKENNLTAQQKQFAKSIYNAGNDLLALINDILDLSKIEARKLRLTPESISVEECLSQLKLVFEPQAKAKNLDLNLEISGDLKEQKLFTDRQRLEQILRNFLSNAIKFTEKGHIGISAAAVAGDKSRIDIQISDTGLGIPREKQELVFEAFEQADGSVSRRFGGTGLGLTISRELAQLLGGEILLSSKEGKGSSFTLRIPFQLPDQAPEARNGISSEPSPVRISFAEESPSVAATAAQSINLEAQKRVSDIRIEEKTILIVEDDDKFRKSVVEVAGSYGFHSIEAEDGEIAVAILQKMTPKAILLDIKLPGISGMGILEMIKQMPHLRHVPVHMISALDYQLNALRMGALGYLTKPVTMEKIRSALDRIDHMLTDKVRRVLLIEDDETQSAAVSQLIAGSDVEVLIAGSGQKAMEILKKGGVDCIILDLSLPDLSGFDLLEKLNGLHISLPPIVIYTGQDLSSDEEERLRKYSQSIIIKGVRSPERLLDEVNLFLHRVESLLPQDKREMLSTLRSQDRTFEGKSVLLVDDDLRNLFALTSALEVGVLM